MAVIGSNPASWNSFSFTGLNTLNQVATLASITELGRIVSISAFFGGDGATVTAALVLWNGSGTILAQSSNFTAPSGSRSSGGQSWQTQSLTTAYLAASGASFYIGFWRAPSGGAVWSYNTSSGTWYDETDTSGSPGAFTSPTSNAGAMGAYATYNPVRIYVRRSGAWTPAAAYVRRSGAWKLAAPEIRRSGTWNPVGEAPAWVRLDGGWERGLIKVHTDELRHFGALAPAA